METTIYQAKHPTFRVDKQKQFYKIGEYCIVFNRQYDSRPRQSDKAILEWMFEMDNLQKSFTQDRGHTLSVGDIIELDKNLYICCSCGWKKIEWLDD